MTASTGEIFSQEHFASTYPPGIEHHFWNSARNRIIASALRKHGAAAGHILEIGCGTGVVVAGLRGMGFNCWGSEMGMPKPAQGAEGFLYLGQDCNTLDVAFREKVETVLLLDVIEHVADPVAFMISIREHFPHARTLLVTVPARRELWSNYDDTYGHLRRYDRGMLAAELRDAGFRMMTVGYFFHALYLVMLLLARSGSGRQTDLAAPKGWKRVVHKALAGFCEMETRLLPDGLVGTSVLAVAKTDPKGDVTV